MATGTIGCQSAPTADRGAAESAIALAAGEAIVFDARGGPVDVPGEQPASLTLEEAVRRAVATHPAIQAALGRVRAAQADADQVRLLPNPILSVVVRIPEGGGSTIIEAGLAADLVALLQRPGRVGVADSRLRAASAAAVVAALDVIADVQARYVAVQALDALVPLLEQRQVLIARLQELARSRLRAGEGSRLETVTLDAQQVELEAEVDDLLLQLTEERLVLTRLVGQPSGGAGWTLSEWRAPAQNSVSESVWVAAALERRPEVQQQVFELAATGAEVRLAGFGVFDQSSIGVYGEKDGDLDAGPAVSAPIPLFDWGQARRARAQALRITARHDLTQVRREIVEQVRRAAAVFNESVHELRRVRLELLPLQQERRDLAEAAFRAGQTDVTTVILSERDLAAARERVIELERRNAEALLRLQRAVGGPVAADALIDASPEATSPDVVPVTRPGSSGPANPE